MSDDLNNDAPASSEGRRYEWFKMWSDVRHSEKIGIVAKKAKQPSATVLGVWTIILSYANTNKQSRGSIEGLSTEVVSFNSDLDEDVIDSILNHMQGRLLDGHKIIGWEERQREKTDNTAADRQRAKRAKDAMEQKLAEMQSMLDEQAKIIESLNNQQVTKIESNAVTPDVTPCHADVTPCHAVSRQCHADIDIDKELDKEIDLERDKKIVCAAEKIETAEPKKTKTHATAHSAAPTTDSNRAESPTAAKHEPPPRKPKADTAAKRGTRLPDDWRMSPDDLAFCQAQREDLNPDAVEGSFRDYWHAKTGANAAKLDWSATWRNWVRSQRFGFGKPPKETPPARQFKTAQEGIWERNQAVADDYIRKLEEKARNERTEIFMGHAQEVAS